MQSTTYCTIFAFSSGCGESSLDILVYYFTRPVARAEHLRVRQEMNLAIMGLVEKWGTSIAFPTRTLHLHGDLPPGLGKGEY